MALPNTPIETPTTLEIQEFIVEYYKAARGITSLPDKSIVRILAGGIAAIYVTLFMFATWAFNQIFIGDADPFWVETRGRELGIDPKGGQNAIMTCLVTGATAAQIEQGTLYQYNDIAYTVNANATVVNGEATIFVEAPEIGEAFEISPGEEITLVKPIVGVPAIATVQEISTDGVSEESDDDYYQRVDTRIKLPPQGGAPGDYFLWTTEVEGISDCYVYQTEAGDVDVYPIAEGDGADRIPSPAQITEVEQSIETSGEFVYNDRRPVNDNVLVSLISNEDYDVEILGFGVGRPPSLEQDIEAELKKYFEARRASNPALGKTGNINLVNINAIVTIINTLTTAAGFSITGVIVTVNNTPISVEIPVPQYNIASLGNVIYAP